MKLIYLSQAESQMTGYRVGRNRAEIRDADLPLLWREVTMGAFDVVRLKVGLSQTSAVEQLTSSGVPFGVFSINLVNEFDPDRIAGAIMPAELSCEEFDGQEGTDIARLIRSIYRTKGWYEYRDGLFRSVFSNEVSEELAIRYFSQMHRGVKENARTWVLQWDGEPCGIFMGERFETGFYGKFYGINDSYRGRGVSKTIYSLMASKCREEGWSLFLNDIHVSNVASLRSAYGMGMKPKEAQMNLIIYPMLTSSLKAINLQESQSGLKDMLSLIASEGLGTPRSYHRAAFTDKGKTGQPTRLRIVAVNKENRLLVATYQDSAGDTVGADYFWCPIQTCQS